MANRVLRKWDWVKDDPYWSKRVKPGQRCTACSFPAEEAPNGPWCPWCGYPDNPGSEHSLVIA